MQSLHTEAMLQVGSKQAMLLAHPELTPLRQCVELCAFHAKYALEVVFTQVAPLEPRRSSITAS
jgi:hypothetical protein